MNPIYLTSLIVLYIIIICFICFNVFYSNRFKDIDKKVIIGFLLVPPIGIFLFLFLRIIRKDNLKKQKITRKRVYIGKYDGGHNKPIN